MRLKLRDDDMLRLERTLESMYRGSSGIRFATRNALNEVAFLAMREAKLVYQKRFIKKPNNTWTMRNFGVEKATAGRLKSVMGHRLDYMRLQEVGGIRTTTGGSDHRVKSAKLFGLETA